VGVVVLDTPVILSEYGELAALGAVNALNTPGRPAVLEIVGYGLQSVIPSLMADRVRYRGNPTIFRNSPFPGELYIHVSANPGKVHAGGSCFGDSGGPALLGNNSNVVVAMTSFGFNGNCVGPDFFFRVDTQQAQDFINPFLPPTPAPPLRPDLKLATTWATMKARR